MLLGNVDHQDEVYLGGEGVGVLHVLDVEVGDGVPVYQFFQIIVIYIGYLEQNYLLSLLSFSLFFFSISISMCVNIICLSVV